MARPQTQDHPSLSSNLHHPQHPSFPIANSPLRPPFIRPRRRHFRLSLFVVVLPSLLLLPLKAAADRPSSHRDSGALAPVHSFLSRSGRDATSHPIHRTMASELQPPSDRKRVKVYELRDNDWFDRGTGFCTGSILHVSLGPWFPVTWRPPRRDAGYQPPPRRAHSATDPTRAHLLPVIIFTSSSLTHGSFY